MANVYYAYNTTDLYLSNSDLSSDSTYGTAQGYTCGTYTGTNSGTTDYNKSTCTKITILNTILPDSCYWYFNYFKLVTEIIGLDKMDTSNVTNMSNMFYECRALTSLDLSNFDTSNVATMSNMFYYCKLLTSLNVSNFNTSKVTAMNGMFQYCQSLTSLNVSNFNTSRVNAMAAMFWDCRALTSLDLSNFDTSKVNLMNSMFNNCLSLISLDISNFNTSKVTNMSQMFYKCPNLKSIYSNDFDISRVTNSTNMFADSTSLVGAIPYDSSKINAQYANTITGYFTKPPTAYVRTLQDEHDCIIYPQTISGAVGVDELMFGEDSYQSITDVFKKLVKLDIENNILTDFQGNEININTEDDSMIYPGLPRATHVDDADSLNGYSSDDFLTVEELEDIRKLVSEVIESLEK